MADFGHGIGADYGAGQGHEPYLPYGQQPPEQAELELGTAHARARALAETGDLTVARSMIEDALATGELRLGRDHPALVPLMVDLATIARRLGNLTEARNQLRRAHAIVVAISGPEHPTSLSLEGRIAAVGYRLGEVTAAYDQHLADVGARVLGPDHPAVRGAQQRLGIAPAPAPVPAPPDELTGEPLHAPPYVPPPQMPTPQMSPPQMSPPQVPTPQMSPPPVPPPPAHVAPAPAPPQPTSPARPASPARPHGQAIEGEVWAQTRDEPTTRAPRRADRGGIVLIAALAALVLGAAAVVALQLMGGGPFAPGPVTGQSPTAPTTPVTELELVDNGGSVTLTWPDPSGGQVPFVVSGGRVGSPISAIETLAAGRTTATIYGLNINFDYCFTVAVVWSADNIETSAPVCTHRPTATPT